MKEMWDIEKLHEWDKNPRSLSPQGFERLKKQIQKLGVYKPLLTTKEGTVLGGNMRLKALRDLGHKEVWVSVVDAPTEEKKIEYALSDNDRVGKYEGDQLADLIGNFPEVEWNDYAVDIKEPQLVSDIIDQYSEVVEDEVPEVPKVAESKLGEVYTLGRHRLMCGDATKIEDVSKLMDGNKADMVFTDPPYGMDKGFANDEKKDFELQDWNNEWMKILNEVSKENCNILICHSPRLFWTLINPAMSLTWEIGRYFTLYKPNDMTFPWHCWLGVSETMLLFMKGKPEFNNDKPADTSFWHDTYNWSHKNIIAGEDKADRQLYHPTVKPLPVCQDLIWKCSFKDNIVLDTFGGSGTTLIACEQTNRTCYMMEIDPLYCDVIRKRYDNFISNRKKTGNE